jgi:lysozyme family protein
MRTIEEAIDDLLAREGGYVNHPSDRGGPTKYGITEAVARRSGYHGDMRNLPESWARAIYRRDYWDRPGYSEVAKLSVPIALELLDTGVNMGRGTAGQFLQRSLNILQNNLPRLTTDGSVGPATRAALERYLRARPKDGEAILLKALNSLQGARYIEIAEANESQRDFVNGWLAHRVGL